MRVLPLLVIILGTSKGILAQDFEQRLNVSYGSHPLQQLDLYLPKKSTESRPAVLWIHGGGWQEGDKRDGINGIGEFANALVEQGYVAVAVNYRLAPEHPYPAQIDDVQRAVRWLRANAESYGIDPQRIGATGISAGGHLASMLAVRDTRNPQWDFLNKQSSRVQTAVSFNGPTDLRNDPELAHPALDGVYLKLFGEKWKEAGDARADFSPVTFVDKRSAPVLFLVGSVDPLVWPKHSLRMAAALKDVGVESRVTVLENASHGIFPGTTPIVRDEAIAWLNDHLRKKK